MKKLITVILLLIVTVMGYTQELRLRSYSASISHLQDNGEFENDKINLVKSNILILITKNTISIYAKTPLKYSIISKGFLEQDALGAHVDLELLDNKNIECLGTIFIIDDIYRIFIGYSNVILMYNCKKE